MGHDLTNLWNESGALAGERRRCCSRPQLARARVPSWTYSRVLDRSARVASRNTPRTPQLRSMPVAKLRREPDTDTVLHNFRGICHSAPRGWREVRRLVKLGKLPRAALMASRERFIDSRTRTVVIWPPCDNQANTRPSRSLCHSSRECERLSGPAAFSVRRRRPSRVAREG